MMQIQSQKLAEYLFTSGVLGLLEVSLPLFDLPLVDIDLPLESLKLSLHLVPLSRIYATLDPHEYLLLQFLLLCFEKTL
jgi:hypothetical protein